MSPCDVSSGSLYIIILKWKLSFLFLKSFIYFIFGCVASLLLHGFSSSCDVRASLCGDFSCGAGVFSAQSSVVVAHGLRSCSVQALENWLSSCGTQVLVAPQLVGIFLDQGWNPCRLHR